MAYKEKMFYQQVLFNSVSIDKIFPVIRKIEITISDRKFY